MSALGCFQQLRIEVVESRLAGASHHVWSGVRLRPTYFQGVGPHIKATKACNELERKTRPSVYLEYE